MALKDNPGRIAGLLYVLASLFGIFALLYVPSKIYVSGDAAATANNISAHETLFRLSIAADLIGQALFVFVALALFALFKDVNYRHALAMLTLILVAIPIAFLNEVNTLGAIALVRGSHSLAVFDKPQREALANLFLDLRGSGFDVAGIFWGLWLFPLGLLSYRSGIVPRILGVLLMIGCFAYLTNSLTSLALPQYAQTVSKWVSPIQIVELLFMFWLLVMGAKPKPVTSASYAASPA